MNKTIILPIISSVALILKSVFGLPIGDDLVNALADLILGAITIYGIFKNHKTV